MEDCAGLELVEKVLCWVGSCSRRFVFMSTAFHIGADRMCFVVLGG